MMKKTLIIIIILFIWQKVTCQKTDSLCNCQKTVPIGTVAFGSMSFIALNEMWYKDYPRSSFHFFNDGNEWLQMDKMGHAFSTYQLNQFFFNQYQRTGYDMKRSLRNATISSLSYMTTIELLDGFSKDWGFSPIDFCANLSGGLLHLIQQKKWKEQKIQMKFSYHETPFAKYNPSQLGDNFQQRVFKDYNAQTYWVSFNSTLLFNKNNTFRDVLSLSIGYSASEMTHAKTNNFIVNNFQGHREFLFSFDADLNRVKWKRKGLKKVMRIFNVIKVPLPTMKIRENGKISFHLFYF
jgi:hypothetical protein